MNVFSISDIESLSGIRAHTLRIWEQRYDLLNPKRKASKHRTYDNEDLKYILRIAYLYNKGMKISHIAGLGQDEIQRRTIELNSSSTADEIFLNQLIEATLDFDQPKFDKILHNLVLHLGFEKSVFQVLFPLLNKIGLLWMLNKMHPTQEHFASSLIIKKMLVAIDGLEKAPHSAKNVLLFTPENEFHEIPLLMIKYLLKKNHVSTCYLGSNVTPDTVRQFCEAQPCTHLYFHLITFISSYDIAAYLEKLNSMFPEKEIYCSGTIRTDKIPKNVHVLKTREQITAFTSSIK
jgi:MerR family transcriptional regulator, light-induced transcriptional regulator